MPEIVLNAFSYPSYATVAEADSYLAADVQRADDWAGTPPERKARALISATRLLGLQNWTAGAPPSTEGTIDPRVVMAAILLAADVAGNPALASGVENSNVKRVKAGSAEVEFFAPVKGGGLPPALKEVLGPLLGGSGAPKAHRAASYGVASGSDFCSRFDNSDFRLSEPFR